MRSFPDAATASVRRQWFPFHPSGKSRRANKLFSCMASANRSLRQEERFQINTPTFTGGGGESDESAPPNQISPRPPALSNRRQENMFTALDRVNLQTDQTRTGHRHCRSRSRRSSASSSISGGGATRRLQNRHRQSRIAPRRVDDGRVGGISQCLDTRGALSPFAQPFLPQRRSAVPRSRQAPIPPRSASSSLIQRQRVTHTRSCGNVGSRFARSPPGSMTITSVDRGFFQQLTQQANLAASRHADCRPHGVTRSAESYGSHPGGFLPRPDRTVDRDRTPRLLEISGPCARRILARTHRRMLSVVPRHGLRLCLFRRHKMIPSGASGNRRTLRNVDRHSSKAGARTANRSRIGFRTATGPHVHPSYLIQLRNRLAHWQDAADMHRHWLISLTWPSGLPLVSPWPRLRPKRALGAIAFRTMTQPYLTLSTAVLDPSRNSTAPANATTICIRRWASTFYGELDRSPSRSYPAGISISRRVAGRQGWPQPVPCQNDVVHKLRGFDPVPVGEA